MPTLSRISLNFPPWFNPDNHAVGDIEILANTDLDRKPFFIRARERNSAISWQVARFKTYQGMCHRWYALSGNSIPIAGQWRTLEPMSRRMPTMPQPRAIGAPPATLHTPSAAELAERERSIAAARRMYESPNPPEWTRKPLPDTNS